jgi:hypothetical protein
VCPHLDNLNVAFDITQIVGGKRIEEAISRTSASLVDGARR